MPRWRIDFANVVLKKSMQHINYTAVQITRCGLAIILSVLQTNTNRSVLFHDNSVPFHNGSSDQRKMLFLLYYVNAIDIDLQRPPPLVIPY